MSSEVYINQVSAFLPNESVSNDQMEHVLGMVGDLPSRVRKMILRSNDIHHRYYAIDPVTRETTHTNTELGAKAVELLFQQGVSPTDVTFLAAGTSIPDQILPGHASMIHGELSNVPPYEIVSTAGVCLAGMMAMKSAYNSIKTGEHNHAISVASENPSACMRSENFSNEINHKKLENATPVIGFEKDFLRWMLSDGSGAVYLSNKPNSKGISLKMNWIDLLSFANEMPVCMYMGGEVKDGKFVSWRYVDADYREKHSFMSIKQDVHLLNDKIGVYALKTLEKVIAKHNLKADDIDYFLPHYSSGFFRDKLLKGLEDIGLPIPEEKWFTNLHEKGNTGAASIYIILEEFMHKYDLKAGQKILCYIPESGRFSYCFMLLEVVDAG
ncbi:beta-ketoacyl-ACP synthase III [Bisgaard Taxon 10/6]|uniref:Beta-ketoacyl-ACP synthase III n=1 Tax=Exercitatus varius TaxID=67857 RepID=A0AAW6QB20_9PAST|nr:beta-ketoacyl-ACP synthase III [Exercitatus varius]MDG2918327.1 beta-ketoacyl-ACP synthase III [Exercitatus varius]MDG2939527.1 beta-ketoacyl-ACP synthase III [Exercitatus varius]MDG2940907.1 beta-ketoacyl-ACP synthase III [Exercitatus varius]MDG2944883.1 beta-ketoacyl-ACP synthase III [Exercitatus varius]MDG2949385.1 beta-ketoacyl-ACP synthase III [Exercitatus varius]